MSTSDHQADKIDKRKDHARTSAKHRFNIKLGAKSWTPATSTTLLHVRLKDKCRGIRMFIHFVVRPNTHRDTRETNLNAKLPSEVDGAAQACPAGLFRSVFVWSDGPDMTPLRSIL